MSGGLAFSLLESVLDGCTNLINTSGLLNSLAQHPEIVHRRLGMHRKPHQDRGSRKHPDKAFADFLQEVLSSVVDPTAAKVDPEPLKVGAGIPVDLDDVGGQKRFPCLVSEGDQRTSKVKVRPEPEPDLWW